MNDYRMEIYQLETTAGKEWAVEFPDLKGCCGGGSTIEEAIADAQENKEAYIADLKEEGKKLPIPTTKDDSKYSGKFTVRMSKSLHRKVAERADTEQISMNQFITEAIAAYLGGRQNQNKNISILCTGCTAGSHPNVDSITEPWDDYTGTKISTNKFLQ